MDTLALIGLGSNLGDRKAHLGFAVAALRKTSGVSVRAVSSYHETTPAGGPAGQGAFLNAVALIDTNRSPLDLLRRLHDIERDAGRVRSVRWGERTLDLDLLLYGESFLQTPELTVPHPRMSYRRFVIAPAAEIAPNFVHPLSGRSIIELLAILDGRPSYLALAGPPSMLKRHVFELLLKLLPSQALEEERILPGFRENDPTVPSEKEPAWRLDTLEIELEALHQRHWPPEPLGDTWLVSDFCYEFDRMNWYSRIEASLAKEEDQTWGGRRKPLLSAWNQIISPTLTVLLDGPGPNRSGAWLATGPQIWPDGKTPEVITAEICTACAATRPGQSGLPSDRTRAPS